MSEVKEISKEIFRFVYIAAMQDAVRQNAYSGKRNWLWNKSIFEKLYEPLKNHIDSILNGDYDLQQDENVMKEAYDNAFIKLAKDICSFINEEEKKKRDEEKNEETDPEKYKYKGTFTFGNAQKLINMTVKYFYITTFNKDKTEKVKFQYCHCPMDEQMLNIVWKNKIKAANSWYAYGKDGFKYSWSNEEFLKDNKGKLSLPKRYSEFQKAVRELVKNDKIATMPIEYDYVNWENKSSDKD